MTSLTHTQVKKLERKLDPKSVQTREQGGRRIPYVDGWHVKNTANEIFGFDGWSQETPMLTCVFEGERPTRNGKKPYASYLARVRVTVHIGDRNVVREGIGAGGGFGQDLGEAHESAAKEAETDALKRALSSWGNQFGLALYDKQRRNVGFEPEVQEEPPAEAGAEEQGEAKAKPKRTAAKKAAKGKATTPAPRSDEAAQIDIKVTNKKTAADFGRAFSERVARAQGATELALIDQATRAQREQVAEYMPKAAVRFQEILQQKAAELASADQADEAVERVAAG